LRWSSSVEHHTEERTIDVKHLDKALIASGLMLVLSGGIAAAALNPGATTALMTALPGEATLVVQNSPFGSPHFFAAAATYIGITEEQLRTELQAGKTLAEVAIAHGKTRDGLVAALTTAATQEIATLVDQKGLAPGQRGPGGPGGPGFGRGPMVEGNTFAAAATYLGITEADLRTKMQSGQTLAQVAAATAGKSRDGLIQALVADATKNIDAAQSAGKITADQATQIKSGLTDHITRLVDSTGPGPRPFGPRPSGAPAPSGSPRP